MDNMSNAPIGISVKIENNRARVLDKKTYTKRV